MVAKNMLLVTAAVCLCTSCESTARTRATLAQRAAVTDVPAPPDGQRNVYFGDLHLHTTMSMDAYHWWGTTTTPEQAYQYARGDEITFLGQRVKRREPLDFLAVTDHSENIGAGLDLQNPESALSKSEQGRSFARTGRKERVQAWSSLRREEEAGNIPGFDAAAASRSAWQRTIDAANQYYAPGKFTTFIAYEWTGSSPNAGGGAIHRNVIFRGDTAPAPFTARDAANRPERLWTYLEENRQRGIEGLVIPHNGNMSNGVMYDWVDSDGRPIDESYAQRRLFNEPLTEIAQMKGQSETHPTLSPNDEFASFELYDLLFSERGESKPAGSYIRDAYGRGLVIKEKTGRNPYKFGVVGATDQHSGLSFSDESEVSGAKWTNAQGLTREEAEKTLGIVQPDVTVVRDYQTGSGGLTGVWANDNTRQGIYDALRRKETFATSGTRIQLRFFGGWDFDGGLLGQGSWPQRAYSAGVSMGSDLPARPRSDAKPRFVVWATKDPNGANLDRAQIVKVWLKDGVYAEKVFDVAASGDRKPDPRTGRMPAVGNTVDLRTARYTNTIGAVSLSTVWQDPEFDRAAPAVYYLRVLEIPTPRWSTMVALKFDLPHPATMPPTIQERAWSSGIWYVLP